MHTLIWVVSALAAGALARVVMKSQGRGFVADTVLGALGSISGAWLLRLVDGEVPAGGFAHVGTAFFGAVCLVAVGRLVAKVARGAGQMAGDRSGTAALLDVEAQIRRLSALERAVLSRVLGRRGLPPDPTVAFQQQMSFGDRVADRVAYFGGSWTFLGCFAAFMLAWMFLNTATPRPADPYPFILLNLVLSCLAAVQAPVIMMSQNRQAVKDRFEAQQDYQVNLRAEMQITELHLKLDEARNKDWQSLVVLHQQQLAVLERIERALGGGASDAERQP
jgi:uncharacterized membrane protein/uncharacterized membrane protein YeaQ/YmgE (transglycosylase-associated protein family)